MNIRFNKQQWLDILRNVIVFGCGVLVAKGTLPADFDVNGLVSTLTAIVGGIGTLVAIVQSLNSKTDKNQIAAVAAMPDVAKIVVAPTASNGVAAALKDETVPFAKVVTEGTHT